MDERNLPSLLDEKQKHRQKTIDIIKGKLYPEYSVKPPVELGDLVLFVSAETGSGKSTVIPIEVLKIISYHSRIICTQPRILTAISLKNDVQKYNSSMATQIGYQTGPFTEKLSSTRLLYSTTGILLMQLKMSTDDEMLNLYRVIILDEIHEQNIENDTVLLLLKLFLQRCLLRVKNIPIVILMSATADRKKYMNFFKLSDKDVIDIPGRSFPIKTIWPQKSIERLDISTAAAKEVANIIASGEYDEAGNDIIIFSPSKAMNMKIKKAITSDLRIITIDRADVLAVSDNFKMLNMKSEKRKVIISTNVAETGLTIPNLKYCIDTGWGKIKIKNFFPIEFQALISVPIPQSRVIQRRGRVGRKFPGTFLPLYTEKTFDGLLRNQWPDITLSGIEESFLSIYKNYKQMIDPMSFGAYSKLLLKGTVFGFIDVGGELTNMGKVAAKFNKLSLNEIKILFSGVVYGICLSDLVTIIAFFGIKIKINKNIIEFSKKAMQDFLIDDNSFRIKMLFMDHFIILLYFYSSLINTSREIPNFKDFLVNLEEYGIDTTFISVLSRREEIIEELLLNGINPFTNWRKSILTAKADDIFERIKLFKRCLYEGLRFNLLEFDVNYKIDGYSVNVNHIFNFNELKELGITVPKFLVTDNISMPEIEKRRFVLQAGFISVLDGYVGIDKLVS